MVRPSTKKQFLSPFGVKGLLYLCAREDSGCLAGVRSPSKHLAGHSQWPGLKATAAARGNVTAP